MQTTKRDPIEVYSGVHIIDIANLKPEDVDIDDIALSLAHQCRYNGHLKSFYSVAEHCIYVSKRVQLLAEKMGASSSQARTHALSALLHDAGEAYLSDIVYPLKNSGMFDEYMQLEAEIEAVITEAFDLDIPINDDLIKDVDSNICNWEKAIFREYDLREAPHPAKVADVYVLRFHDLTNNAYLKW